MLAFADADRAALWRAYDSLPEKTRAEIVDGEIIVRPAPANRDRLTAMYLVRLLSVCLPEGWGVAASGGVILDAGWDVYLPDVLVAPVSAWAFDELGPRVQQLRLVAEVNSASARDALRNRRTKYAAYARAAIPLYLLVDRYDGDGFTTLYSNPSGDEYLDAHKVPFGEKLMLPKPFDIEIDMAQFQVWFGHDFDTALRDAPRTR